MSLTAIAMEGTVKVHSPSPEEAAFRKYYGGLLSELRNPMKFAQFLLLEGVIGADTKESITSLPEEAQKRLLLDSVQFALSQSSDASATLRHVRTAMDNSGIPYWCFHDMDKFIRGE